MDYSNLDKLLDAVFIVDEERKVHYANECATLLVGISLVRLRKGMPLYNYIQFEDETLFCMENGVFDPASDNAYREVPFVTKKGAEGICQVLVEKETEGNHWIVFIRDMTLENSLHSKYKAELAGKEDVIKQLEVAQKELKKYSESLEDMVEDRTEKLNTANKFMKAMMNSLGQGLLVFDHSGICLPTYTKACETLFGKVPEGKSIWDIIPNDPEKVEVVKKWTEGIFKDLIPFDNYAQLGPKSFNNIEEMYVELEYFPMRDEDGDIEGVVTVATDKTAEIKAEQRAQEERDYAERIIKMITCKDQLMNFIHASRQMIKDIYAELNKEPQDIDVRKIFIAFHSIKGGAGQFNFTKLEGIAHLYENHLGKVREMEADQVFEQVYTIRNNASHLEKMMEEEIMNCRQFLGDQAVDGKKRIEVMVDRLKEHAELIKPYGEIYNLFEEEFLRVPVESLISAYGTMAQDIASKQEKELNDILFMNGSLKVDPEYYQELMGSLVHVFRNAVDHGLEPIAERNEIGKMGAGNILVEFHKDDEWLNIVVSDDGRGIDPEKIRNKCLEKGISVDGEEDHDIIQMIFQSSFSTRDEVTNLSGRGVGMDAVKTAAEKLGGKVEVFSTFGRGTRIEIFVPWDQRGLMKNAS